MKTRAFKLCLDGVWPFSALPLKDIFDRMITNLCAFSPKSAFVYLSLIIRKKKRKIHLYSAQILIVFVPEKSLGKSVMTSGWKAGFYHSLLHVETRTYA